MSALPASPRPNRARRALVRRSDRPLTLKAALKASWKGWNAALTLNMRRVPAFSSAAHAGTRQHFLGKRRPSELAYLRQWRLEYQRVLRQFWWVEHGAATREAYLAGTDPPPVTCGRPQRPTRFLGLERRRPNQPASATPAPPAPPTDSATDEAPTSPVPAIRGPLELPPRRVPARPRALARRWRPALPLEQRPAVQSAAPNR